MRLSISQITTLNQSFADDLDAYRAARADGIGIWEMKLGDDSLEQFRTSGLSAAAAIPAVPSILPLPLMEGPADPAERVEAIRATVRRLAPFEPECVLFLTGPSDGDRDAILEGIRAIADEGEAQGVPVALEAIQREFAELWSIVSSLGEAAALVEESGAEVGLMYDSWHLWREPTRSTNDRVLPGDGVVEFGPILDALRWEGFYDLEIFSDPELPGSLWQDDPRELAARGVEALRRTLSNESA